MDTLPQGLKKAKLGIHTAFGKSFEAIISLISMKYLILDLLAAL